MATEDDRTLVDAAAAALRGALGPDTPHLRALPPRELVRLLNSTPWGECLTTRRLDRHRDLAGSRIGDGRSIDLFRYAAWLLARRHAPGQSAEPRAKSGEPDLPALRSPHPALGSDYELHKERSRERNREMSLEGRDIGPAPDPVNPGRRAKACESLQYFLSEYFPEAFRLEWSPDHLDVIRAIEEAVRTGGLFALAMPRGNGKTTICIRAAIWAMLTGQCRFVTLIGATMRAAVNLLKGIKTELTYNEELLADFPKELWGIPQLGDDARGAKGQLSCGERTNITWQTDKAVLPTLPKSACSGAVVTVCGLTGSIRGQQHTLPSGEILRPSLVLIDDPQTRKSARSRNQSADRAAIIAGDVLGMAGPGRAIAAVMPCTVIVPGDTCDELLDRDKHPEWQGRRTQLVYAWPENMELWEQYAELRREGLRGGDDGAAATAFYKKHRKAMDAGSRVAWPQRKRDDELSALQHAMNLRFRDEHAFFAEYQNEPLEDRHGDVEVLAADAVVARGNGLPRGILPPGAEHVTAFVDAHDQVLYWTVAAWKSDFTGAVVDYGAFPDQRRKHFTHRKLARRLADLHPKLGKEAAVLAGLEALTQELFSRTWTRAGDDAELRIGRCLVDSGYLPDQVKLCCRRSQFGALLAPSRGQPVGAKNKPLAEYHRQPGDKLGHRWILFAANRADPVRRITFDTNYWKSFLARRLQVAVGDPGALTLFGDPRKGGQEHALYAEHLTAEEPVRVEAQGRTVDEWRLRPGRDNHWFDTLVGCAVAASWCGAVLRESTVAPNRQAKPRKRPRSRVAYL